MKAYEVLRKGNDGGVSIPRYGAAVAELVSRMPAGDFYQWKRRGDKDWKTVGSKPQLKDVLGSKRLKVGEAFWARRKGGTATFILRAIEVIEPSVPCPDSSATPGVKLLWDAAQAATREAERHFGRKLEFVFMGIYNCRRIDGSLSWSQHAFRNGLDFRIRRANAPDGSIDTEATTFVVNKVKDKAAEALWLVRGHTYHAHLTGKPKLFGTPSCA